MIELGDRVKDRISGLQGIVMGITNWLYGCRRLSIQPEESKDGKPADFFAIDEPQALLVQRRAVVPPGMAVAGTQDADKPRKHGPRQDPSRY